MEFNTRVASARLLITRMHPRVVEVSKIQRLLAALHNTGWTDDGQIRHGSFKAISILDPVDDDKAYSYSASCHHCLQWHVRSYGQHFANVGWEVDTMVGRIILSRKGCTKEAVHILSWSHSNDRFASHFCISLIFCGSCDHLGSGTRW